VGQIKTSIIFTKLDVWQLTAISLRPSFLTRRMVRCGNRPLLPKFWVKLTLFERKHRFWIDIRS